MQTDDRNTRPGDALVRAGAALFAIGLIATLATVLPLFLESEPLPRPVYLVAALAPIGFAVALVGLLRSARSRRRPQR